MECMNSLNFFVMFIGKNEKFAERIWEKNMEEEYGGKRTVEVKRI